VTERYASTWDPYQNAELDPLKGVTFSLFIEVSHEKIIKCSFMNAGNYRDA
jgi:hypothetical protein